MDASLNNSMGPRKPASKVLDLRRQLPAPIMTAVCPLKERAQPLQVNGRAHLTDAQGVTHLPARQVT